MILIELNGERLLVGSLDGYDGCTVIAEDISAQPDDAAELVDGVWAVPLAILQDRKWEEVKARRELVENDSAPTPAGLVQIDEQSKIKINGLVTMAMLAQLEAQPFSEEFTMADNAVVTLDAAAMIAMGVAVGQFVSAAFARARDLRDGIDAATSAAELDAIDIETGWPS